MNQVNKYNLALTDLDSLCILDENGIEVVLTSTGIGIIYNKEMAVRTDFHNRNDIETKIPLTYDEYFKYVK